MKYKMSQKRFTDEGIKSAVCLLEKIPLLDITAAKLNKKYRGGKNKERERANLKNLPSLGCEKKISE